MAAQDFNPHDQSSWYFGSLSREAANNILMPDPNGVFLVRDSTSIKGDFVLCVKEENKVSHYIINKIQVGGMVRYRIGEQEFPDMPSLLNFYKTRYLDTTCLIRPAPREQYIAKFDFEGRDPEDLPFRKGEILTILQHDEEKWWTARNSEGRMGLVPEPYLERYLEGGSPSSMDDGRLNNPLGISASPVGPVIQPQPGRQLPAKARVIKDRVPSAYDHSALKLRVGDILTVLNMHLNGQWEGELNGKRGLFPFNYVEFI